jgi:hypothetical protein
VTSSASGFETFSFLSKGNLEIKNKGNSCAFFSKGYIWASPLNKFLEHLKLCAQYVTLQKHFSHPSFSYLLCFQPHP